MIDSLNVLSNEREDFFSNLVLVSCPLLKY